MNSSQVLLLAFLIGVISGLRSLTAPVIVAWAARRNWLSLLNTPLFFMASTPAVVLFTVLAVAELVADKLPTTPSRIEGPGLIARVVLGSLSGAALALSGRQSIAAGIVLGGLGGFIGAFAGYEIRRRLVQALKVPDLVIAILEDAVAITGGLWIVTRF
jgi:uncharacterized membrane protein